MRQISGPWEELMLRFFDNLVIKREAMALKILFLWVFLPSVSSSVGLYNKEKYQPLSQRTKCV